MSYLKKKEKKEKSNQIQASNISKGCITVQPLMADRGNEINVVRLQGTAPAVTGESSGSASGLSPDGAAGVWTQQLSNPGTDTGLCSRAKSAPPVLQEHWPATSIINRNKYQVVNAKNIQI